MQEIKKNKKQVSLREEFMREYLFSVYKVVGGDQRLSSAPDGSLRAWL